MTYRKSVTYMFEVDGETWEILDCNHNYMLISETRKNGQEDCHTSFEVSLIDGVWTIDEHCEKDISNYWYTDTVENIEAFLNNHGLPG